MRKLIVFILLPLFLPGCSDDQTTSGQVSSVTESEQAQSMPLNTSITEVATNTNEESGQTLSMPLNTPISEVASSIDNEGIKKDDSPDNVKELEWDELMPKDYRIEEILEQINAGELSDDDPRIDEAMEKVKEMYSKAPVVEELDNTMVKLPGFVVPMNMDGKKTTDFLLVPYYGACIHVPPPPVNQTVFVTGHEGKLELYDTVWVTGKLKVERSENELGDSGYTIKDADVKPYE